MKMKAPEGSGGFGHGGEFYQTDKKGLIDVPASAVRDAEIHGFTVYTEPEKKTAERPKNEKSQTSEGA